MTECLVAAVAIFEEKGIILHFYEDKACFVLADKEMLTRMIENLICNCITHSNSDITIQLNQKEYGVVSFINEVNNPNEIDVE